MTSTDLEAQEQVCINGPYTFEGLRDGVTRADDGVELLEPRTVPLAVRGP